jgi:hypothetical protein
MADGEAKPLSRGVMDKETKSFIESQTTDIIGVIRDMADMFGLKIDRVEGRLGMVEGRLGMVEGRLGGVETRLATLETDMAEVKSDILELKSDMSEVKVETGETKCLSVSNMACRTRWRHKETRSRIAVRRFAALKNI